MKNRALANQTTTVALRVTDLRAEFEAQLRSVFRLEEQLRRMEDGGDPRGRTLASVVRRELAQMLENNTNINKVLTDLADEDSRKLVTSPRKQIGKSPPSRLS